jgi:hypothetical protein
MIAAAYCGLQQGVLRAYFLPLIKFPKSKSVGEFQCGRCGSIYNLAVVPLSMRLSDEAVCLVCQMVLNEWRGTLAPIFKLKSRSALYLK